jgi:hypothetical protein
MLILSSEGCELGQKHIVSNMQEHSLTANRKSNFHVESALSIYY